MRFPARLATLATISALFNITPIQAQTYTDCNPLTATCPADPALGTSLNINFAAGQSSQFTAQGVPTYSSNGVQFTIAQSGNAPTLVSKWYIMFGEYSITMQAAPGQGIVSSVVLESDDLDEIDWEWVGSAPGQVQSNYFGKGQTTTYDRGAVHTVADTESQFHTYTLKWTESQIVWSIDGTTVRVLNAAQAGNQYPQTPMQLKIGSWSGGDPSNAPGTIQWAGGPTNYAAGPYTMTVKSLSVTDYSTGTSYTYGDKSGNWESIEATNGQVNGNIGGGSQTVATAPAITSTSSGNGAWDGTHKSDTATATYTSLLGLPSGWTISSSGKALPPSAATTTYQSSVSSSSAVPSPAAPCSASGYSTVTTYNQQGFLTTATVPIGLSTGWDDRGFATTIYPAGCQASQAPVAANDALHITSAPLAQAAVVTTTTLTPLTLPSSASASGLVSTSRPVADSGSQSHQASVFVTFCVAIILATFLIWTA